MATNNKWGDGLGITASVLCLVHCVLLPLMVTTVSIWGIEVVENVVLEVVVLAVSMVVGGWALWKGYQNHQKRRLALQFCCGLLFVVVGNWVAPGTAEVVLKLCGALLLIVTHLQNLKYSRACSVPQTDDRLRKGAKTVNLI